MLGLTREGALLWTIGGRIQTKCYPAEVVVILSDQIFAFHCLQHIPHALLFPFSSLFAPYTITFALENTRFSSGPSSIHLISLRAALARLEHKQSNRAADSIYRCAANSPR